MMWEFCISPFTLHKAHTADMAMDMRGLCRPVQGQEGDYVGGTLPDRGARAEPGTESILSTGLALGRVTIGFGSPASRGRGLAGADYLLRSDEDAMAWLHAGANSIRERGRRNSGHAAEDRAALSISRHCPCGRPVHGIPSALRWLGD